MMNDDDSMYSMVLIKKIIKLKAELKEVEDELKTELIGGGARATETWQEKMKKYNALVEEVPTKLTKDENLMVNDMVKHSFGCMGYKLMRVARLTEKTIWYEECLTHMECFSDDDGDIHTYMKYMGNTFPDGIKYKRKRRTNVLDDVGEEENRGQYVYIYNIDNQFKNIWIKKREPRGDKYYHLP
jgi:hypothetical protein